MLKRVRRRILAGLVSALLLAAQQGALAHLVSHADGTRPAQEKTHLHQKLCGKCLSTEKLCHALDAQARPLCADNLSYAHVSVRATAVESVKLRQPCCRDPPQFL